MGRGSPRDSLRQSESFHPPRGLFSCQPAVARYRLPTRTDVDIPQRTSSAPPPPLLLLFALPRSRQALANLAAIPASQYLAERHRFFNLGFTAILKKVAAASRSLHGTGTESGACVRNPKNRHHFLLQLSIKSARRQTPKSESDKSPQLTAAAAPHLSMRQNG